MGQNQTRSGTHQKQPKHVRKAIHSNGFCNLKSPCFGYSPENEPVADDNVNIRTIFSPNLFF